MRFLGETTIPEHPEESYGCNETSSHGSSTIHHGETESPIFGTGSHLTAPQLFLGFLLVSLILAMSGEGLNILEEFTKGTTYHLMLQRIYREIMMMGLMSFALSLALLAGVPFPHGLMIAFEFGDITLFMTSIHFCLQGLWVMFVSIGLGNAWDRASKITSEELQIDVETCHGSSKTWRHMYYPFSVTRNQVEFRILQSIFSSAYNISTKYTELNFGLFLKMTHEDNLLNIIDFDISKWFLILFLIGVASLKVQFYHSECDDPVCEAEEEIWIFTCGGVIILLLSILLFYWGRKSEILLIQKSGVESIDDYPVFLMVESQMQAQLEKNALKTANVKTAINELMVEAESSKLESEAKKRKELRDSVNKFANRASAKIAPIFDGRRSSVNDGFSQLPDAENQGNVSPRPQGRSTSFFGNLPAMLSPKGSQREFDEPSSPPRSSGPSAKYDIETGAADEDLDTPMAHEVTTDFIHAHGANSESKVDEPVVTKTRNFVRGVSGDGFVIGAQADEDDDKSGESPIVSKDFRNSISVVAVRDLKKLFSTVTGQGSGQVNSKTSNRVSLATRLSGAPQTTGENKIENLHHSQPETDVTAAVKAVTHAYGQLDRPHQKVEFEKAPENGGYKRGAPSISTNLSTSVNKSMKAISTILGTKPAPPREDSVVERKQEFKARMKTNFRRQNFSEVFVFGHPHFFYVMIDIVMACNSLYLALWTTNFAIVANRGENGAHSAMLIVISILPALFAFPFVAQAIKSSSILKAVTKLNLDVVASVVEKTENKIKILEDLRKKLSHHLRDGLVVSKAGINLLYEKYNFQDPTGLTRNEFIELLEGCRIHYTVQKCKTIFSALDINQDGFISMEEFERFLFPEETLANDKKRQKFFDAKNSKMLGGMGKHAAAKRILKFLDPNQTAFKSQSISSSTHTPA